MRSKTAHVYVMEAEDGTLKVGHSRRPDLRRAEIKERGPLKIVHLRPECDHAERLAHKLLALAGKRIKGEWFNSTLDEATEAIERAERIASGVEPAPAWPIHVPTGKTARLDMRVTATLKARLERFAEKDRRRLTDLVEIVLSDYADEREKREAKRK